MPKERNDNKVRLGKISTDIGWALINEKLSKRLGGALEQLAEMILEGEVIANKPKQNGGHVRAEPLKREPRRKLRTVQ